MSASEEYKPERDDRGRSLARLWVTAQPSVSAYIWSCVRDFHTAEDLLQDVAEDVAGSFERYDPERPFVAWALGIARFKVLDHYRKNDKDPHIFNGDVLDRLSSAFVETFPASSPRREALEHCVSMLPPKSRRVLEMRYDLDMKPIKIAEQVGSTSGSVRVALTRIRNALAQCIEKRLGQTGADHG